MTTATLELRARHADKPDRSLPAPEVSFLDMSLAQDAAVGNLDVFTDWLAAQCYGVTSVSSDWELRSPDRMQQASTPALFSAHLKAVRAGDAQTSMQCMQIIADRYLADNGVYVIQLAQRFAEAE